MNDSKDNAADPAPLPVVEDEMGMFDLLPPERVEVEDGSGEGPSIGETIAGLAVLGGLALVTSGTREEPAALQPVRPKKRRRSRGGERPQAAGPELAEWFTELDRVNENTVLKARRFTDKNWASCPTDDDVIVLLGHVVRRKVASDAAMMFGNERLLRYVLSKKSYEEIVPGFFSDGVKAIMTLDFSDAARFGAELTDRLGSMPLWDRHVLLHRENDLRARMKRVREHVQQALEKNNKAYDDASVAVWSTPKRRGRNAEKERLIERQDAARRRLTAGEDLLEQTNRVFEALEAGRHSEAIEFLQSQKGAALTSMP